MTFLMLFDEKIGAAVFHFTERKFSSLLRCEEERAAG